MGPTPCDVYCAEGNCMRKQPCPANEVWGNDKLTQSPSNADLREAIEKIFSKHKSTKHIHENNSNYWPLFADLIALFQAREQQLLTELLGELPEKPKKDDIAKIMTTGYTGDNMARAYSLAISEVVSIIAKYREGL